MARPGTPYETVKDICNRLVSDGLVPSYRLVAAELEGNPSKKTVLEHIEQWRNEQKTAATIPGLSEAAVTAFKAEIAVHVQLTQELLEAEIGDLRASNREALEALEATEEQNLTFINEVAELKENLNSEMLNFERTDGAQIAQMEELKGHVRELQKERDQLITSGEAARTEAARAQLQFDQATKAVSSAEKRETELNNKIESLTAKRNESEKMAAVAAAHVEELQNKNTNLETRLKDAQQETASIEITLETTRTEKNNSEKSAAVAEQLATDQASRIDELEKIVSDNKELQQALTGARQEGNTKALLVKDAEQKAAVAEQKASALLEKTNELKNSLNEALKKIKELEKKKG